MGAGKVRWCFLGLEAWCFAPSRLAIPAVLAFVGVSLQAGISVSGVGSPWGHLVSASELWSGWENRVLLRVTELQFEIPCAQIRVSCWLVFMSPVFQVGPGMPWGTW